MDDSGNRVFPMRRLKSNSDQSLASLGMGRTKRKYIASGSVAILLSLYVISMSLVDNPMNTAIHKIEEKVTQWALYERPVSRQTRVKPLKALKEAKKEGVVSKVVHKIEEKVEKAVVDNVENLGGGGLKGVSLGLQIMEETMMKFNEGHKIGDMGYRLPPEGYRLPPSMPINIQDGLTSVDWVKTSDKELRSIFVEALKNHITKPVQKGSVEGIDFYWQLPFKTPLHPKAILFLAHSCGHSAIDWFSALSKSAPEEQAIVTNARKRGMMVVAMDTDNQCNKCWDHRDGPRIASVLNHVRTRHMNFFKDDSKTAHIPLFAFGVAAGATVLNSYVPNALSQYKDRHGTPLTLSGIIVQNVGGRLVRPHIPTVYISLSEEIRESEEIDMAWEANTGLAWHIKLPHIALKPDLLFNRIKKVSLLHSRIFYKMVEGSDLLEVGEDGKLISNPERDLVMQQVVREFTQKQQRREPEALYNAIMEVLMVVWGQHAITRDGVGEAFEWLLNEAAPTLTQR